jgi:hypothetical protein
MCWAKGRHRVPLRLNVAATGRQVALVKCIRHEHTLKQKEGEGVMEQSEKQWQQAEALDCIAANRRVSVVVCS